MCGRKVFVVDIEASGFGGWPIELGWSLVGSGSYRSFLIRPDRSWDLDLWDDLAESVHGISLETVMSQGRDIRDVVAAFLEDVHGAVLVSDAPEFDNAWLNMMFDTLTTKEERLIRSIQTCFPGFILSDENEKEHRAGPDALRLADEIEAFSSSAVRSYDACG